MKIYRLIAKLENIFKLKKITAKRGHCPSFEIIHSFYSREVILEDLDIATTEESLNQP